jgi:parallel beta-helix repeat protein
MSCDMSRRIRTVSVALLIALVLVLPTGSRAQTPGVPVVHPPRPTTNITVSLAEFLTTGTSVADAFARAIQACRDRDAATLVIPQGQYRLNANINGFHVILANVTDLTIDGQGAEIIFANPHGGIYIGDSQRIVIRNLSVDYDIRTVSPGVIQKESDGTTTIRVADDFPVTAASPVVAVSLFNRARLEWTKVPIESYYPRSVTMPRPQTFQSPDFAHFRNGDEVIVRHHVYDGMAFFVGDNASDIAIEDVTVYNSPGMAFFVSSNERGFRFSRNRIMRKPIPERLISAAADGLKFFTTRGDIIVEDNDFSGQGDDSLNMHGMWLRMTQIAGTSVALNRAGAYGLVRIGEELRFVKPHDLSEYARAIVVNVNSITGPDYVATLDRNLPASAAIGDLAASITRNNGPFLVRRNLFHDHRARGMLIQSPNGVIENNVIRDVSMTGMHLTVDNNFFSESLGLDTVIVRGNTVSGVSYGSPEIYQQGRHMGAISLIADVATGISSYPVHRNVVIENNTITDTPALAILVASSDGVTVRDNTITRSNQRLFSELRTGAGIDAAAQGSIMITRASNVTVTGNREVIEPGRPDRGIYVDVRNTSNVVVTGNTQSVGPTISTIADQSTPPGTAAMATFTVGDVDTPLDNLVLSATSSNPALLPVSNISFGGSGSNRTVSMTPSGTGTGVVTVAVTVTDGTLTASRSLTLTVTNGPYGLVAIVRGNLVSFSWAAGQLAGLDGFVLEGGLTPGATSVSLALGNVTAFETTAPSNTFYVRVRAIVRGAPGPTTNEVRIEVGTAAAPGAPTNLLASVNGTTLRLAWHNTDVGSMRSGNLLEALTPSGAPIVSLPLDPSAETFSTIAPAGAYRLRVRATGPTRVSDASNEVLVSVPGTCVAPSVPMHVTATAAGSSVTVSWHLGAVGSPAPENFMLEAGLSPGGTIVSVPTPNRLFRATAPPGTYYLRVRAVSACGASASTPEVVLTVR